MKYMNTMKTIPPKMMGKMQNVKNSGMMSSIKRRLAKIKH